MSAVTQVNIWNKEKKGLQLNFAIGINMADDMDDLPPPPPYDMIINMSSYSDVPPPPVYEPPEIQGVATPSKGGLKYRVNITN